MWQFWDSAIQPLLSASRPVTVVEIGAAEGHNTRRLAEWCASNGAVLHSIDPKAAFDVEPLERAFPQAFVMHRALSLEVLPGLAGIDAVLIDGDHNWYTVIEELRVLRGSRWPLVLLHDIGWPYGRRDMYYDPDTIPAACIQPYERQGIVFGQSTLSPHGINKRAMNATKEGGPRNGVLTAVEDFMDERGGLELFAAVSESGGMGILVDSERLDQVGAVVEEVRDQGYALRLSPRYASRRFESRSLPVLTTASMQPPGRG
jgi:hypothetical protein